MYYDIVVAVHWSIVNIPLYPISCHLSMKYTRINNGNNACHLAHHLLLLSLVTSRSVGLTGLWNGILYTTLVIRFGDPAIGDGCVWTGGQAMCGIAIVDFLFFDGSVTYNKLSSQAHLINITFRFHNYHHLRRCLLARKPAYGCQSSVHP